MPVLVVQAPAAARLRRLAAHSALPTALRESMAAALCAEPLLGVWSAADVQSAQEVGRADGRACVPHRLLVDVVRWAQASTDPVFVRDKTRITPAERAAWRDARGHTSAMANVLVSMGAVATGAWWAGGNADVLWKVAIALALALLVGVAEVVLYARHWRAVEAQRRRRGRSRGGAESGRPGGIHKPPA
ncbi:hypothetical protein MSPP1_002505 [Malassezia sp. CBS 17886]|nr:hypothetical protein MSPP1_002505 [Malassezia sp. CBS 17886]